MQKAANESWRKPPMPRPTRRPPRRGVARVCRSNSQRWHDSVAHGVTCLMSGSSRPRATAFLGRNSCLDSVSSFFCSRRATSVAKSWSQIAGPSLTTFKERSTLRDSVRNRDQARSRRFLIVGCSPARWSAASISWLTFHAHLGAPPGGVVGTACRRDDGPDPIPYVRYARSLVPRRDDAGRCAQQSSATCGCNAPGDRRRRGAGSTSLRRIYAAWRRVLLTSRAARVTPRRRCLHLNSSVLGLDLGRVGRVARRADADGDQGGLRPRRGIQTGRRVDRRLNERRT